MSQLGLHPDVDPSMYVFIMQAPLPQSYLDDLPELLTDYKPLPKINQGFETRHSKAGKSY